MNIGDQVSHYILEEKIGDGGFGDVYRARDINSGLNVALKISRPDAGESKLKDREQRFLREVSCISKLRHPNIVQLFDYGSLPDGTLFLVMEYVCGLNLEVLIKRDAPFSFVYASEIILQVLDALDEAHRQGIVHRDLKPANIMLVRQGLRSDVVKLLDFGIAKAFDGTEPDLTRQNFQNGAGFGTPQYMPPEQFYGKKIGPHTDLYAVGLVFYELLTGKQAFTGKSLSELIQQQIHKFPEIPAPFNEGPLDDIFRRALAKQISMRYSSAQEMYQDIDAITRFCSPYLQKYSYVTGADRASLDSHTSSKPPQLPKAPKYEEGDLDLDNEVSTQDTMLFANQNEDVDISNYNTLVFDGQPSAAMNKYPPNANGAVQQSVTFGDDSYIGDGDDDDDIEFLGPTDDMSRVDPAVAMQSAYHASSQYQQNYNNAYSNPRLLPPTANSMPPISSNGFPRPNPALPPTTNNVPLNGNDSLSMNPTVESRQPSFPMQEPVSSRRSSPYSAPANFDPDDQPTHMMPEMPSDEMGICTGNLPARPEFAQAMRQPVVPLVSGQGHSSMARTADLGPALSPSSPKTEDLPPVFHQQRTNFLHDRSPSKQRKTVLNNTFLGFWDSFFYKVRLFPPIAAFLNSGFYRSCRHAHHRVALFIDELYAEHFVGLVCGVCMIIIMLTLIIALIVM